MTEIPTLIDQPEVLQTLMQRARQTDAVALDTEFVWERTYFPQLGLIQLALSDEECYLIDPVAIEDLRPLGNLLADRGVVKIFHDAPQDLAILHRATSCAPQNVFDTRLAAGFAGLPATLSLGNLIKELLEIDLDKKQTRTNWLQRPLTEKQIEYALDDVRYLRAARILLLSRIIGPRIKAWLQEELNLLNNPATYSVPPENERFRRIRGASMLNAQELAVLRNLATWRDGTAQKMDRPRGHIISDPLMIEIARQHPTTEEQLAAACKISKKALHKHGRIITAIVQTTLGQSKETYPARQPQVRLSKSDRTALTNLHNLIELKCQMLGIDPSLVGNGSELKLLVKTLNSKKSPPQHLRQTEGWRKSFLEDYFRQKRK